MLEPLHLSCPRGCRLSYEPPDRGPLLYIQPDAQDFQTSLSVGWCATDTKCIVELQRKRLAAPPRPTPEKVSLDCSPSQSGNVALEGKMREISRARSATCAVRLGNYQQNDALLIPDPLRALKSKSFVS